MMTLGTTPNRTLMAQARDCLRGRWGLAMGGAVVYYVLTALVASVPMVGGLVSLLVAGPFGLGAAIFFLALARRQDARVGFVFRGFDRYGTCLATHLLMCLFIVLWALLLIVPGVIAALRYSQAYYLLAADPSLGAREAIERSKAMMHGHKWKLFCLALRFAGWVILGFLSLGIGFLWIGPYLGVALARFHDDLRGDAAGAIPGESPGEPQPVLA